MRSKRVRNRRQQALPAIQAALTFADVVVEATKRGLSHSEAEPMGESPAWASGQVFVLLGRNLRRQLRRLLSADDHYQELRASQRRRRLRRDEIAKRAYALLADTRKYLQGFYGYEGTCQVLGLRGPTEREPRALRLQLCEAVWWARNWDDRPAPMIAGGNTEAEKCIAGLEKLYAELDQVMDKLERGDREVEASMLDQRAAMAEYDRTYKHSAGAMEAQLIQAGLPTLAAAVRPGIGRRGRPLKKRPVDVHPDLVEQVRAQGLIELDCVDSSGVHNVDPAFVPIPREDGSHSEADVISRQATADRSGADGGVSTGARKDSVRDGEIEQPLHKLSAVEKIIEQPLHKLSMDDEKSQHRFHECSESDKKSPHRLYKQSENDAKSEHRPHKRSTSETSDVFARLTFSPPIMACGQDPRRRDLEGGYRVGTRTGSPVADQRKRREASSWWRRLLHAKQTPRSSG